MELTQILEKRKSIRKFKGGKIPKEQIDKMIELITKLAPSAGNMQAYNIYVIDNEEIKNKLTKVVNRKPPIETASVILLFTANKSRIRDRFGDRGENLYCIQDASIACTYAMLIAVDMGLDSLWMGAFNDDEVINIFDLPKDQQPVAILPIGYADENPERRERPFPDDLVKYI